MKRILSLALALLLSTALLSASLVSPASDAHVRHQAALDAEFVIGNYTSNIAASKQNADAEIKGISPTSDAVLATLLLAAIASAGVVVLVKRKKNSDTDHP